MWPSDPRTAPMLLAQAARIHGGRVPGELSARVTSLAGEAPFLGDDAAMFVRAAAGHNGTSPAGIAGQVAWLAALDTRIRGDVWVPHRGAVLYVLECVATVPEAWAESGAGPAIAAILGLARRERQEAVPLRSGVSFLVVETFAEDLCGELLRAGDHPRVLEAGTARADALLAGPWDAARRWADSRRRALRSEVSVPLLGVPFETACPPPWAPGVEALAARFRRAAAKDVTLYDSAPLTVPVCALALQALHDQVVDLSGDWHEVTKAALDAWNGARCGHLLSPEV